jgi:hypothetical protein
MIIDFDRIIRTLEELKDRVDAIEYKDFSTDRNLMPKSSNSSFPWKIGGKYLIRTVTMTNTGRLVQVFDQELVLEDAAWIADTGRFTDNLKSCAFEEVELFPDGKVIIGRGAVIDAVQIETLPRKQK